MMMQMLAAGGMPILTDGVRAPDEDNPRGYLEFEPAKNTKADPSWVPTAVGKAVKMVTVLLRDLPAGFEYRVILMRREVNEVMASQGKMLERLGRQGANVPTSRLRTLLEGNVNEAMEWLLAGPNFRLLSIEYAGCLLNPMQIAESVSEFLDHGLDVSSMVSAVCPELRRQKQS